MHPAMVLTRYVYLKTRTVYINSGRPISFYGASPYTPIFIVCDECFVKLFTVALMQNVLHVIKYYHDGQIMLNEQQIA